MLLKPSSLVCGPAPAELDTNTFRHRDSGMSYLDYAQLNAYILISSNREADGILVCCAIKSIDQLEVTQNNAQLTCLRIPDDIFSRLMKVWNTYTNKIPTSVPSYLRFSSFRSVSSASTAKSTKPSQHPSSPNSSSSKPTTPPNQSTSTSTPQADP